jgi:hypothetical protein
MRMNRRFDSVASLREGVALNRAGAVPEQVREPRIQLLVGHLPPLTSASSVSLSP